MSSRRFSHIVSFAIILAACSPKAEPYRVEFALNTVCTIMLYDQARAEVYEDIFNRISEIESLMSAFLPGSDLVRINQAAGYAPVFVHEDVFKVIERALHFAEISGGAFDPSVGPLVSLWGIGGDNPRVPSQEEIDAVLPLINWRDIELDRELYSVFLKQPGMALDLGSIAKGFAADEAAAIVREVSLQRALIDLGGNIVTHGVKLDRTPWNIGLQNPLGNRGSLIGHVSGWDKTVVTSGLYERYFIHDDVLYHHIFSPFDGFPARNGLMAVTVVTAISMDADALSTAAFVLGYEMGRALIDSLIDVEAIFVFEDQSIRITDGVNFTLTNPDYFLLSNQEFP
jgi:thiamine biosynthesis lipoprotein